MSDRPADAPAEVEVEASAPPAPWSDPAPDRPLPFWSSLRADVIAHVPPEGRGGSAWRWARIVLHVAVTSRSFHVTFLYRMNHALSSHAGPVGKVLAGIVNWVVHHLYYCSISPAARLHGGLILPHPQGVIIGGGAVVGPRAWIYQNVTIGGGVGKEGLPTVGAGCRIYSGAVLSGPIAIGDEVVVSPNTLVQRNVPDRSLVVGVPGNVFPRFARPKA